MARNHVIFEFRIAYRHGDTLSESREKAQPASVHQDAASCATNTGHHGRMHWPPRTVKKSIINTHVMADLLATHALI
jgi:hypothetical protein